jgi:ketosteroid isomerase-like protein
MRKHLRLIVVILVLAFASGLGLSAASGPAPTTSSQDIAKQIIAREKAAFEAWQRKDKAFWADYLTDDATYFGPMSPYLETEPKVNFLPKFEEYAERFKMLDFQMYNPRVQVYGDTAILTYNSAVMADFGGRVMNYTGKVTSVYVKQGGTWRVVHGHESINPGAQ